MFGLKNIPVVFICHDNAFFFQMLLHVSQMACMLSILVIVILLLSLHVWD